MVGYMGAPAEGNGVQMTEHRQQITVRNGKGRRMLERVRHRLDVLPTSSGGWLSKKDLVLQTVLADDEAKMGRGPKEGAPKFIGELLATILTWLGPKVRRAAGQLVFACHIIFMFFYVESKFLIYVSLKIKETQASCTDATLCHAGLEYCGHLEIFIFFCCR